MTNLIAPALAAVFCGATFLSPVTITAQRLDSAIAGSWNFAERDARIVMYAEADGNWTGVIEEARQARDVGWTLFRSLRFETRYSVWRGRIVRPEGGAPVQVTVRLAGSDTLMAVARRGLLSRTLVLTRVAGRP